MSKQPAQVGRPSHYKPEYCKRIVDFFSVPETKIIKIITTGKNDYEKIEEKEVANSLPHFIDFAQEIDTTTTTLREWAKTYPEFAIAYKKCKELNERFLTNNSLKNLYSASFAIFMAKNKFGWRDEQHVKANIETIIKFSFDKDKLPAGNRLREYVTD